MAAAPFLLLVFGDSKVAGGSALSICVSPSAPSAPRPSRFWQQPLVFELSCFPRAAPQGDERPQAALAHHPRGIFMSAVPHLPPIPRLGTLDTKMPLPLPPARRSLRPLLTRRPPSRVRPPCGRG